MVLVTSVAKGQMVVRTVALHPSKSGGMCAGGFEITDAKASWHLEKMGFFFKRHEKIWLLHSKSIVT